MRAKVTFTWLISPVLGLPPIALPALWQIDSDVLRSSAGFGYNILTPFMPSLRSQVTATIARFKPRITV